MSRYRQTMSELLKQVRESKQKPYVSMSSGGQYNVLDKDGKTSYSTKDKTLAYTYFKKNYDKLKEQDEKDHEISMARGELEAIADKATQLASALQGKSDEGNPLEAWVQSKITKAKDYINSVSDYMIYNPDMKQNEETILEKSFTSQQIKQAYGILNDPRYKGGNYDGAVKAIEKLAKGLSDHPDVKNALKRANEEIDLDESRMKDIFTANQEGESAEEIAKRLKISVKTVKSILGEETVLDEKVADSIIKDLQKAYGDLKGKTISPEMATKISKHLDGQSFDVVTLRQLMKADIPFISTLARNKIYKKTGKFESVEEQQQIPVQKEPQDNQQALNAKDKEIESLKGQVNLLRQKVENEKNRAVKPEPNPETGEVPLTIGIAHKLLKDKEQKEKETKKESVNYPEGAKLTFESIQAVKNKAEKTGMPYSILKQVYDRGMAAWRGGHRPGATQVQWALARVNSFVTKSSGTWGGADSDLAKKVKGEK